ncbi:hypothetical protein [Kordia sp.]|uniref:hypothetical protein n=1 Tax=Kordia sp. TaxID=1965332 RepID=UPI003B5B1CA2
MKIENDCLYRSESQYTFEVLQIKNFNLSIMKKKNLNSKLNLKKNLISNLQKDGLTGGLNARTNICSGTQNTCINCDSPTRQSPCPQQSVRTWCPTQWCNPSIDPAQCPQQYCKTKKRTF